MGKKKRKHAPPYEEAPPPRAVPAVLAAWGAFILFITYKGSGGVLLQGLSFFWLPRLGAGSAAGLASMAGGCALDLLAWALLAAAAHGFGSALHRLCGTRAESRLERLLLSQALGLGALSLLTLGLGAAGWVRPAMAWSLTGLGTALSAYDLVRGADAPGSGPDAGRWSLLEKVLAAVLVYALLIQYVGTLAPETFYDSLLYHLAAPRHYALHGRIGLIEGNLYASLPENMEMLYLLGLLLRGEGTAKLLHFWMMVLTVAAVYGIGRDHGTRRAVTSLPFAHGGGGRRTALAAAALFAAVPVTAAAAWHAEVELALAFWLTMGVWALLRVLRTPDSRWALLSGVFCGLAMGTKYTGLWGSASMGAVLVFWSLRRDVPRVRLWTAWSAAAFLTLAPWLAKNLVLTGSPVYPYLLGLFGARQGPWPDTAAFTETVRGHFFYGGLGSWRTWALTPWRLFTEGRSTFSFIGPLLVLFAPLALLVRRARHPFGWLLLLFGLQYAAWSSASSLVRYLIGALPLFCLYSAHALSRLDGRSLALWAVLPVVVWNVSWTAAMLNEKEVPRAVFGLESRGDFLDRRHFGYPSPHYRTAMAAGSLPGDAVVLVVGEARTYHIPRRTLAATPFDRNPLLDAVRASRSAEELFEALRRKGVTHVLENHPETHRLLGSRLGALSDEELRTLSRFWRGWLKPVSAGGGAVLSELVRPRGPVRAAAKPSELPEIVRIALDDREGFAELPGEERARLMMFVAD